MNQLNSQLTILFFQKVELLVKDWDPESKDDTVGLVGAEIIILSI